MTKASKTHYSTEYCFWNPQEDRPAYVGEDHAAVTVILGAKNVWFLCSECAELPRFRRLRKRRPFGENPRRRATPRD